MSAVLPSLESTATAAASVVASGQLPAAAPLSYGETISGRGWAAHPLWRCLLLYRQMPLRFTVTALLFVVTNLGLSYQQWLIGRAIHDVELGKAVVRTADGSLSYSVALSWLALLAVVALVRGVAQYAGGISALIAGQKLLGILRNAILVQVQRLDLAYHWQHGAGEVVTRTTRDADKVRDALVQFWRQAIDTVLVIVAVMGVLFWYHPLLGLVPLLLTLVAVGIFVVQTDHLVTLDRKVGAAYDAVNQDLGEGIHGVRVIKAFALEDTRITRFTAQVQQFAAHARTALAYASSRIPVPQAVVALGHVWVLGFGARLVSHGQLNLGELVASLLIVNSLVFRLEGVGRVMQVFADARSSAARIWELLDAQPRIRSGQQDVPEGALGLRLSAVRVSAPGGGHPVLNDCSLTLEPGEVVALVGATGSGKSTLASLLARLSDVDSAVDPSPATGDATSSGSVQIGSTDTAWLDVRDLDLAQLRRAVHVVPQESFLFSDSLASNLRLAAPRASDAHLVEGLRLASASEVLAGLKDGLQTKIGERGVTLSGGQRQRVSLARALVSRPRVLVLDDSTSALDAITERQVLNNIRGLAASQGQAVTVLIITSKLSTILLADRVALLKDGRISAQGRHADLAATNVDYSELLGLDAEPATETEQAQP
ncbi:MAG: ABC transporter ATP-binding protein [Rhizobacter sp.]